MVSTSYVKWNSCIFISMFTPNSFSIGCSFRYLLLFLQILKAQLRNLTELYQLVQNVLSTSLQCS